MRSEAEEGEHGKSAKIEAREGPATFLRAFELDCEPDAEEQRERPVRLRLDQPPNERANDFIDPSGLECLHMKMDDEHPEERHAS